MSGGPDEGEPDPAFTLEELRRIRDADRGPLLARVVVSPQASRRRQVAALADEGLSQAEIARRLATSPVTVRKDLKALGRYRR